MTRSHGNESVYTCSDKGLLLPLVSEYTWSIEFRAFVYLIGMLECFLGVAIVADIFMCAIEKITSKTKSVTQDRNGIAETIRVKVWNETVANLTLMALGSSAPEIILTTYETIGNNFVSGELGPGSVVGAAGFNLLVISAACISSIPKGEIRTIKSIKVYWVTTFFGIFAYIWLLLILIVISPDVVEIWEACLTLAFFPIMVLTAYLADKNFFLNRGPGKDIYRFDERTERTIDRNSMIDVIKRISQEPGLTETDAACLAARKLYNDNPRSRMWYRVGAVRRITGGRRAKPKLTEPLKKIYDEITNEEQVSRQEDSRPSRTDVAVIEFVRATTSVWENAGSVSIDIRRHGKLDNQAICRIASYDGTAKAGEDYIAINETVTFRPHEEIRALIVKIVNDNQWEPDEVFYLKLYTEDPSSKAEIIGEVSRMEITILDDDAPGTIHFANEDMNVPFSNEVAIVPVNRTRGADGLVTVRWQTLDQTAMAGGNYQRCGGEVIFQHGETGVNIEVPITGKSRTESQDLHFQIELLDTTGGATLGTPKIINVHITDDEAFNRVLRRVETLTQSTMESTDIMVHSWKAQLKNALSVNGGDIENATRSDFFMHFLTFGWKVLFSFIPPTDYLGGWLTFIVALCAIGVLTAIIGDLASLFGCLVGLKDSVTAITFVALGTSLPDLFASRAAARHESHADSAVGNINGSNSVNVFLGLGISWVIAAIYWASKGTQFVVPKGTLGFSVTVYGCCALVCISLLMVRRVLPVFGKAELGGPKIPAMLSSLFCVALWFIYVLVSSFQAYGYIHVQE